MRSSTPISCSKQGQLKEAAQAPVQSINMDGKSTPCPISLWASRNHVLLPKSFKCSWRFFWWHQPAPAALWDIPHQVLWTYIHQVYLNLSVWLTKGKSSLSQVFPLVSWTWGSWRQHLPVKTKAKRHQVPVLHPLSPDYAPHSSFTPFTPIFFLAILLLLIYLYKPFFLLPFTPLPRFNSTWALAFLTSSLPLHTQSLSGLTWSYNSAFTSCKFPLYLWILSRASYTSKQDSYSPLHDFLFLGKNYSWV